MPINPNEELTPETSQEAFTARTYDPMQPVPEEAETNMEAYIKYLYDKTQRLPEKPDTREEYFMMIAGQNIEPGSDVEPLTVTANGIYSEAGKAYSPVTVNVPLPTNANERKSVTSYPVTDSANYPLPKVDVTVTDADKCEVIVTTDNVVTEDSGVYIERQSGGGNRELDEIVGGSIVWNQLVQNGNFEDTSGWFSNNGELSASNNEISITALSDTTPYLGTNVEITNGHKYIVSFYLYPQESMTAIAFFLSSQEPVSFREENIEGNKWTQISHVVTCESTITSVMNAYFNYNNLNNGKVTKFKNFNIIDLTATFGSTIADYVYSLEQSTAGSSIAWLKSYGYLTEDYYGYTANKIESVSVARHVMKDSNDSVIGSYAINPITLRGIPKLNASNQLYYDGDRYEASGRVTRKYGIRAYQSGDESLTDAITDGTNTVYKMTTPTYEDSSPFEANQIVDANGTEEYIDAGVEAGTRDVAIPVGHNTKYFNGKAYVKPLTAGTSDTISMADMGIMPTSPMYISANGSVDVEYWKSNS